jgi:hypothetical protein
MLRVNLRNGTPSFKIPIAVLARVARFFLFRDTKTGKMHQMDTKCSQMAKLPISQMSIKYSRWHWIYQYFPINSKNYPKWDFWFENKTSGNPGPSLCKYVGTDSMYTCSNSGSVDSTLSIPKKMSIKIFELLLLEQEGTNLMILTIISPKKLANKSEKSTYCVVF